MNHAKADPASITGKDAPAKAPYEPPKITELGSLEEITAGTGQTPGTDVAGTSV